jgi:hypothetical protein
MKRLIGLAVVIVAAFGVAATAAIAAPTNNLLKNVANYTINNGSSFCQYATPQASVLAGGGTASQSRNAVGNGPVSLSITGATGYADNGFYEPLGTLGSLSGYTIAGSGSQFGTNLWLDTNTTNDTSATPWFSWDGATPNCLTTLGGDVSGLGPSSTNTASGAQSVTVNGSSTFALYCNGVYGPVTLANLKAGTCPEYSSNTQVAVWIGITAANGGTLSTRITSAQSN